MTHNISITDGTTTISLTSSGVIVISFPFESPDSRQNEVLLGQDGGELSRPKWVNPVEAIQILITGTALAVRTKGRDIEQLLNKARDSRRVMSNERVYLQVQINGETDIYRTEILAARFEWINPLDEIPRGKAFANIVLTRRYYYESPEQQLSLSSAATSATTDPVTLHNDHDSSTNNYFRVSAAQSSKAGQIPSPMRLRIINQVAGTVTVRAVYITNTVFVHEGSVFRRGTDLGGEAYSTGSSGNFPAWSGPIPNAQVAAYGGRYMRVLAAFNADFDGYIQAAIAAAATGVPIYINRQVRGRGATERIIDVGALPIPPAGNIPSPTNLGLILYAQKQGGISTNLRFVQFTPAGEGLFRRLRTSDMAASDAIIDDGIEDMVYQDLNSGGSFAGIIGYHQPIHIWPGKAQWVRILYHTALGLGAGNAIGVQAWIRARRLTV